jgi:uncharacterized protein YjaZ
MICTSGVLNHYKITQNKKHMKKVIVTLLLFANWTGLFAQSNKQQFITSDIDNFWAAYDKIITTKDSVQQYEFLNKLYIEKGSDGLKSILELKQYTPKKYLEAINQFPLFWQSIRHNSNESKNVSGNVEIAINKLKAVYPELKRVPIYFTVGVFRTNGTGISDRVLIGSEMALTDKNTKFGELPDYLHYFYINYAKSFETIDLLCAHEYIHTQQKELVQNLLSASLYEGVAEFVSTKVVGKPSNAPAIAFGKQNSKKVKMKFEQDMFIPSRFYDWLWSSNKNSFDVRDLGYYIGYAICERNYEMAKDKKKAIKEMIELDYTNEAQIEKFVDRISFFSSTLKKLNQNHEKLRPRVINIVQFKNGSQNVSPALTQITLNFSASMDKNNRGFDFGPLGESNVLSVKNVIGFSEDGKSFTFEIELKPNKRYQILISNHFCKTNGIPLKPFLVDIKTTDK